jgi:hypothetical protein
MARLNYLFDKIEKRNYLLGNRNKRIKPSKKAVRAAAIGPLLD